MCRNKRSTRMAPSYAVADGVAVAAETTPLPINDARPPRYQEITGVLPVPANEKDIEIVTHMSNSSCPEKNCPSKLPMAYSPHAERARDRSCGGCRGQTSVKLSVQQTLSTSIMLLNDALTDSTHRPANKVEAKNNIQVLKNVLREVKGLRRGSHLSCHDKKALKRELRPTEDDVKGVLGDLKREMGRMC